MKLKLVNIISIFIVIIVIGYILLPWSKQNIRNENNLENFAVEIVSSVSGNSVIVPIHDYILNSHIFAKNNKFQIDELKKKLKTDGVLNQEDYLTLINEIKTILDDENNSKKELGSHLLVENDQSERINDLQNEINDLASKIENRNNATTAVYSELSNNTINKTIRSQKYGISINIKELSNGLIMIYLNNGCLTYNKDTNKYDIKHCELTNTMQHFIIKNNIKHNVISPLSNPDLYLKVDNIGISLEKYIPYNTIPTPTPRVPIAPQTPPRIPPTSAPVLNTFKYKKESWEDQGCWNDRGWNNVNDRAIRMPQVIVDVEKEEQCFDKAIAVGAEIIGLQYPHAVVNPITKKEEERVQCFFSKFNDTNNFNDYMKYGKAATCEDLGGAYINHVWKKKPNNWIDPLTPINQLEMGGVFIGDNKSRIAVQAVKKLGDTNGPTIYLIKDGNYIKMVTNDNRQARNYTKQGSNNTTIADLEANLPGNNKSIITLSNWNSYTNPNLNSYINANDKYLVFIKQSAQPTTSRGPTPTPPRIPPPPTRRATSTPTPTFPVGNYPEDFIWIILPFETNGCRKMENKKIVIKQ